MLEQAVVCTVAVDLPGHPGLDVSITRATSRHLGLEEGTRVWLQPTHGASVVPVLERAAEIAV